MRWAAVALASILLHWLTLQWVNESFSFPLETEEAPTIITTQLHKPVPVVAPAKPSPRAEQIKPKPAKSRPSATPRRPAIQTLAGDAMTETFAITEDSVGTDGAAESLPSSADNMQSPEAEAQAPQDDLNLPPSAELKYDVQAQKKGFTYYGTGVITWQTDGEQYLITGKAKAAFFTVLEFKSEGEIDPAGIAPVLYAERGGNRAETNTHFHRERNTISFSASALSYPRLGGEQDRASIIWQLAALGRTRPALFKTGEDLSIFVAGVRNAAPWRIYMIGEEDIQIDAGSVKAWHVKSVPQQGGYEKTFDIWFSPGYEWYPVKLRQTELSGDYLELTLSTLLLAQR
jgi:hypothetical protein